MHGRQTRPFELVAPFAASQNGLGIINPDAGGIAAGTIDGRCQIAPQIQFDRGLLVGDARVFRLGDDRGHDHRPEIGAISGFVDSDPAHRLRILLSRRSDVNYIESNSLVERTKVIGA